MSTQFLLQDPSNQEFFSSFYYSGGVGTIPVLFGAEEFETKDKAFEFKNSDERLNSFIVVARKSSITVTPVGEDEKVYQEHEQRVIDEKTELQKKLNALFEFLKKGQPDFIDDKNWQLLDKQYQSMSDYNETLKQRIELF